MSQADDPFTPAHEPDRDSWRIPGDDAPAGPGHGDGGWGIPSPPDWPDEGTRTPPITPHVDPISPWKR